MSGVIERSMALLERLAQNIDGLALAEIADDLQIPKSAAHRLLSDLVGKGYVRQSRERGNYFLTTQFISLGLNYLKISGVMEKCQPVLDGLAGKCGEFVQLAVVDVDRLSWIGRSQGARSGLLYNGTNSEVILSSSSTGLAWLCTLSENDALHLVARQGYTTPAPNAPSTPMALLRRLRAARKLGYALTIDSYSPGLAAIAVPVLREAGGAVGVLTISGPSVRLGEDRLRAFLPDLLNASKAIAQATEASPLFNRPYSRESHASVARRPRRKAVLAAA